MVLLKFARDTVRELLEARGAVDCGADLPTRSASSGVPPQNLLRRLGNYSVSNLHCILSAGTAFLSIRAVHASLRCCL